MEVFPPVGFVGYNAAPVLRSVLWGIVQNFNRSAQVTDDEFSIFSWVGMGG